MLEIKGELPGIHTTFLVVGDISVLGLYYVSVILFGCIFYVLLDLEKSLQHIVNT